MDFNKLVSAIENINVELRQNAVDAINQALTIRNWLVGAYIVEYEQRGEDRAAYREFLIESLSKRLKELGTKGLTIQILHTCKRFYLAYPQIVQTLSAQFGQKVMTLSLLFQYTGIIEENKIIPIRLDESKYSQNPFLLLKHFTFSHFIELIKADTPIKRAFYETLAIKGHWTVRQLRRQMGSLLYERTGLSKDKEALLAKINSTSESVNIEEAIRDPYILEFTGLKERHEYSEHDLETALLDHIQDFLLELGTGFCFESRQKRITIDNEHDRIDLVFYHRILKCHILIDLKTRPFTNADAGQMNFYLNYFKNNELKDGDNPPVGLILCTDKDEVKVQYATGGMDNAMFISRYMVQLPSEKVLEDLIKKDIEER
jgi:predicted nuclease of restriction endonuclease-like (RecB) superfamily